MKAVIQRVSQASVSVDGEEVSRIGAGLVVLLGVVKGDGDRDAAVLAKKIAGLRIFADEAGKMNLSVADVNCEMLAVSQFTLAANCKKGRRPSFDEAAPPDIANPLFDQFCDLCDAAGIPVKRGVFAAHMEVVLTNDGPVTIVLDSAKLT